MCRVWIACGGRLSRILIRKAAENNLKRIDLDLPLGALITFVGPSGSGKSSLAFDTLYAEGRRRYLDALGIEEVDRLPVPDTEGISGLPPTVGLEQRSAAPNGRWTVGTVTGIHRLFQVLFRNEATLHCPRCGTGMKATALDDMVEGLLRGPAGRRVVIEAPLRVRDPAATVAEIARQGFSRVRVAGEIRRIDELSPADLRDIEQLSVVVDRIKVSSDRTARVYDGLRLGLRAGQGIVRLVVDGEVSDLAEHPTCFDCGETHPSTTLSTFSYFGRGACGPCAGAGCEACGETRLGPLARGAVWEGRTLVEWLALSVEELRGALRDISSSERSRGLLVDLARRAELLSRLGLEGLPVQARCVDLSAGQYQLLRVARLIGEPLTQVLYLLDEPTAGLDAAGARRVTALCRELVQQGNTVIAVTHRSDLIREADTIVEFGPGAGVAGGQLVFQGTLSELLEGETPTARWLKGAGELPRRARPRASSEASFVVHGQELAASCLGVLCGPAASGKSWFIEETSRLAGDGGLGFSRVVSFGAQSIGRSQRSNLATYTGIWDVLRPLLAATQAAQIRGLAASYFSLNTKGGRCERCRGAGVEQVDLGALPDVYLRCASCDGRRFHQDVLDVRWKGLSAGELLDLSVSEGRQTLSGHPKLERILRCLELVGLGYMPLGQSAHTWSGGEARRIGLARELSRYRNAASETLYLLDGPEIGLHHEDQHMLVTALWELIEEGATVWLASHAEPWQQIADQRIQLPER
jgi:excinuclease ABC subunit A